MTQAANTKRSPVNAGRYSIFRGLEDTSSKVFSAGELTMGMYLIVPSSNHVPRNGWRFPAPRGLSLLQRLFDAGSACLRPPCLVLARISICTTIDSPVRSAISGDQVLKNIYVGNISFQTSEQDLSSAFSAYGQVDRVQIIKDRETGQSRGFAFVEMPVDAEADRAIQALDGAKLDGRAMKVNEAQPREPRRGPGGGGGGYDRAAGGGGGR